MYETIFQYQYIDILENVAQLSIHSQELRTKKTIIEDCLEKYDIEDEKSLTHKSNNNYKSNMFY